MKFIKKLIIKYIENNAYKYMKYHIKPHLNTQMAKKGKVCYVCAIYSGVLKAGVVRYVATDNEPEAELETYRSTYGSDIRARYVKVEGDASAALQKLSDHLGKIDNIHDTGYIYKLLLQSAVRHMKEAFGVNKAYMWGGDDEKETDAAPASAASASAPAVEADEIDNEEEADKVEAVVESKPVAAKKPAPVGGKKPIVVTGKKPVSKTTK